MNNPGPTIERLMAGLRDAEPQNGIKHRIFQALQARETIGSFTIWHRLRPQRLPAFAIWMASALAIAATFVAIALHERSAAPRVSSHPPTLAVRQKTPVEPITQPVSVSATRSPPRIWSKHLRTAVPVPDLRAASSTERVLPLTEQERLLLRLAHRRDRQNIVMLNPAAQAAQSAKANELFQQFFGMSATEMRNQNE